MIQEKRRKSFWAYYFRYFIAPTKTADALIADDRRVRLAAVAVLIPAVGYTFMYLFAWIGGGAPSTFTPWLAIPKELYFKYAMFLVAPSMFICWALASAVVQLLSASCKGRGSFEDTATVIGFGIGAATWSTLLHDLADAALGAPGVIELREYEAALNAPTFRRGLLWTLFTAYFAWFIALFSKGIAAARKVGRGTSIFLAATALIVYQVIFLVFNR